MVASLFEHCIRCITANPHLTIDQSASYPPIPTEFAQPIFHLLHQLRRLNAERFRLLLPSLIGVDISDCPAHCLPNEAFQQSLVHFPPLSFLNLSGCEHLDVSALSGLPGSVLAPLRALDLSGAPGLLDIHLSVLASHCRRLEHLTLCSLEDIQGEGVWHLVNASASVLESLDLSRCTSLLGPAFFGNDFCPLPRLACLRMCNCAEVAPLDLCVLVRSAPALRKLSLVRCTQLEDAHLMSLFAHAAGLHILNLKGCYQLTGAALVAIADRLPALRCLHLAESLITDGSLRALAESPCAATLQLLDIAWCDDLTDEGVARLLPSLPALRALHARRSDAIGDKTLFAAAKHCRGLETIVITRCDACTAAGLLAATPRFAATLVHLDLSWCPLLTNRSVALALLHCSALERLVISGCRLVSDHAFVPEAFRELVCAPEPPEYDPARLGAESEEMRGTSGALLHARALAAQRAIDGAPGITEAALLGSFTSLGLTPAFLPKRLTAVHVSTIRGLTGLGYRAILQHWLVPSPEDLLETTDEVDRAREALPPPVFRSASEALADACAKLSGGTRSPAALRAIHEAPSCDAGLAAARSTTEPLAFRTVPKLHAPGLVGYYGDRMTLPMSERENPASGVLGRPEAEY